MIPCPRLRRSVTPLALLVAGHLLCGCEDPGVSADRSAETPPTSPVPTAPVAGGDENAEDEPRILLEPELIPVERVVVTGVTVYSDFERKPDGTWSVLGIENATILVEQGKVARIVAASTYSLGLGDIVVSGGDRFVMAAPIVMATADDAASMMDWLAGGRLVDCSLAGVGRIILPEELVDGPHGRCVQARIDKFELPAAMPLGVDASTEAFLDGVIRLPFNVAPAEAMEMQIRDRLDQGQDPIEILAALTRGPAAALGRPEVGVLEKGASARLLVLSEDPTQNPLAVLEPYAMTFGDRVMRRAEMEVLRDASLRTWGMRDQVAELTIEGIDPSSIRRWTTSTQAQVFAGIAAGGPDGDIRFSGRTGEPRFDAIEGRLRLRPPAGDPNLTLSYTGPPESFEFTTTPNGQGLGVELRVEGRDPFEGESPGSSEPPIVDLAIDLDVRRTLFTGDEPVEMMVQELIYGNGPIGLSPRRYRFTRISDESCPPCFEEFDGVWRLEIVDEERAEGEPAATATIGWRDGRPARGRFEIGAEILWVDELPGVGRPRVD